MTDIIEDLSKITTISTNNLNKLIDKSMWCICDYIEELITSKNNVLEINIGIGTLIISILDNQIKYKFIPNAKLENSIRETIINEYNPLKLTIEKTLVNKITNTYKDLI